MGPTGDSLSIPPTQTVPELMRQDRVSRTDTLLAYFDRNTLQQLQDSLTAAIGLHARFADTAGRALTEATDPAKRAQSDALLGELLTGDGEDDGIFRATISAGNVRLGTIELQAEQAFDIDGKATCEKPDARKLAVGIELLHLIANSLTRLCEQEIQSRQRVEELAVLYRISTILSGQRDLRLVLDLAARSVGEVMDARAVSIRLLDEERQALDTRASYRLSPAYLEKGALDVEHSPIFTKALAGEPVYVADMGTDPRVLYPEEARAEGLVSMLCVGIAYQGKAIGTVQVFTGKKRRFTEFESDLIVALAQILGAAIENARLDEERREKEKLVHQLHLAGSVQRRMLPQRKPDFPGLDIAARYIPSYELAGDFYDFLRLEDNLGIVIGDVVGKGVAASLLMASVRASLRAYAQDLYDIDEIMSRVNRALTRDTLDSEFATLFYGVIDPRTLRLTYCNAGHEPPLLRRNGRLHKLEAGGLVVGVEREVPYDKGLWDLEPGDLLVLVTDGVTEAQSFDGEQFGRERLYAALLEAEGNAEKIMNHLLWQVRRFTGIRRANDDTTLVVVRVDDKR
ncbi:SpoIIE family protein phosphatase [Mucisphaera sp.]|uniref:PP2C family protein-serine/threonine phosphatase n=1 Tax=Mucisphaera sp. TaxID=2913024 RepID=UPI003D0BC11E